ncbi:MAG: DNA mismatch repair protein MutS [Bacteroides sp.]|nr:DNA mismatch repair protein MutS [Bacteroides sp.]
MQEDSNRSTETEAVPLCAPEPEKTGAKGGKDKYVETPLMKQYYEIKRQHPEAVLLFRVGDFYETFGEDAVFASRVLNIVLTRKASGAHTYTELAGFPHHALETYLYKLVKAGGKVAICEQLEDPKLTKKLVKRGVSELITPGIAMNDRLLETGKNNFLCGISPAASAKNPTMGVSFLDVSTGEFFVAEGSEEYVRKLLDNFQPSEVVMPKTYRDDFCRLFGNRYYITVFDDWVFKPDFAKKILLDHFKTNSLKGFGVEEMPAAQMAAGACLHYLVESKHELSGHVSSLQKIAEDKYVWMDAFTLRNLELLQPSDSYVDAGVEAQNSLYAVLNKTNTPMGARLLRRMICLPLKDVREIDRRLAHVDYLVHHREQACTLRDALAQIGDLERMLSKVAAMRIQPRELWQLRLSLDVLQQIIQWGGEKLESRDNVLYDRIKELDSCRELSDHLARWLNPEAPALLSKGNVIAEGADAELDELRRIAFSGKEYLSDLLREETQRSGITTLKVGFNNVYGYYFEVSRSYKDKVPASWVRKQTLTNAERYTTEELKVYEEKVLTAQDKITTVEARLYQELVSFANGFIKRMQVSVQNIAFLDVVMSFADAAVVNEYVRPKVVDGYDLQIRKGRHPVIERHMPAGQKYVPNDITFTHNACRIMMITGPNMSGKSAVLRQTALIVLMAQIGCFVPAQEAVIGWVDKIFTRVGATDNIAQGESTFMVEMNETANILNNLTARSLVLLDEIGRGTSTYDGISIAWAIAEYLHEQPQKEAKVLFATHYHELNRMAESFQHIENYHIKVKEENGKMIFLRTLAQGGSEHSFGIHVAQMAGMPKFVLDRAKEILAGLERDRSLNGDFAAILSGSAAHTADRGPRCGTPCDSQAVKTPSKAPSASVQTTENKADKPYQLSFIQLDDPLLEKIRDEILDLDVDSLTPIQALNKLDEIKRLLKRK